MKVQIGYEHFPNGDTTQKPDVRLTPISTIIPQVPAEAEALFALVLSGLPGVVKDQTGGGEEIRVPLVGDLVTKIKASIPILGQFLPTDGADAFIHISA